MKYHVGLSITKAVDDGIDVWWKLRMAWRDLNMSPIWRTF